VHVRRRPAHGPACRRLNRVFAASTIPRENRSRLTADTRRRRATQWARPQRARHRVRRRWSVAGRDALIPPRRPRPVVRRRRRRPPHRSNSFHERCLCRSVADPSRPAGAVRVRDADGRVARRTGPRVADHDTGAVRAADERRTSRSGPPCTGPPPYPSSSITDPPPWRRRAARAAARRRSGATGQRAGDRGSSGSPPPGGHPRAGCGSAGRGA
jgi:hypothetical protein